MRKIEGQMQRHKKLTNQNTSELTTYKQAI